MTITQYGKFENNLWYVYYIEKDNDNKKMWYSNKLSNIYKKFNISKTALENIKRIDLNRFYKLNFTQRLESKGYRFDNTDLSKMGFITLSNMVNDDAYNILRNIKKQKKEKLFMELYKHTFTKISTIKEINDWIISNFN